MMHACQSEANRSGGAPAAVGGRMTRHLAARSAKIAVAAALDASSSHLFDWRAMTQASDQWIALFVARYQIRIALIAMPTSTRTREDTRQSLSASPIRSYISSSTAADAAAPDDLICSRIAAA